MSVALLLELAASIFAWYFYSASYQLLELVMTYQFIYLFIWLFMKLQDLLNNSKKLSSAVTSRFFSKHQ